MAIVEEEAKAEGEHIDGAKFEVQTVEGSFVNIDNSMLVRGLPPTDAEHTPTSPVISQETYHRKRRSHSPNPTLDSAVVVDTRRASKTGLASPTRSSLSDSGLTAVDSAELANIQEVQQMAEVMKGVMGELGLTFDSLGGQTAYLSSLAPILETQHNIRKLERMIVKQEERQLADIEDLRETIEGIVQEQIIDHLKKKIEELVDELVERDVDDTVQDILDTVYMPQKLQETVNSQRRQLDSVRINLHNTEARRTNSVLKAEHMADTIVPLLKPDGTVSEDFPKNLSALFAIDHEMAKSLLADYGVSSSADDSRDKTMNSLMYFLGVGYQLLPGGASVFF